MAGHRAMRGKQVSRSKGRGASTSQTCEIPSDMERSLLDQFLTEECTPAVASWLNNALANDALAQQHFEFNRFEITIQLADSVVIIADVLDATDTGTQHVPLEQFASSLRNCSAK
jgi:hypothetical protein